MRMMHMHALASALVVTIASLPSGQSLPARAAASTCSFVVNWGMFNFACNSKFSVP